MDIEDSVVWISSMLQRFYYGDDYEIGDIRRELKRGGGGGRGGKGGKAGDGGQSDGGAAGSGGLGEH